MAFSPSHGTLMYPGRSGVLSRRFLRRFKGPFCGAVLSLGLAGSLHAQTMNYSAAGDAAARARRLSQADAPYTFKSGDLKVLLTSALGVEWNDNINTANTNSLSDWILRPHAGVLANYPVTDRNLLTLNVGVGYSKYLQHDHFSSWTVDSDSQTAFDLYFGDFWINLHERFSCSHDSSQQSQVANTGDYSTFNNTVGEATTWDLQDVTLMLGYDHNNEFSTSSSFSQIDQQSENLTAQAALHINPVLQTGIEGSASFVRYDQAELNNYNAYSVGGFADWRPGPAFHVHPRAGYTIDTFSQTSTNASITAQNQDSWYADLTLSHAPADWVEYSLSMGHQLSAGIESDAEETWYVRPAATWKFFRNWSFNTFVSYEHGTQTSAGNLLGIGKENYDWLSGGCGISYAVMQRVNAELSYRATSRYSNQADRSYLQNSVVLVMTYTFD